jgi:hypothetical protein
MTTELEFGSSQEAWEGINEYFMLEEEKIVKAGGTRYGALLVGYDFIVRARKLWVDPDFDYGKMFNYRRQKWVSLVNNYVDFNYLDLVKAEVLDREKKKASSYNISFIFGNSHGSGKGCLLNLTFTRRPQDGHPLLIATLRSSEIVKRLNFDFLLIQRMGEYVYGEDVHLGAILFFPNIYTSAETSAMYNSHKKLKRLFKQNILNASMPPFQQKVWEMFEKYSTVSQDTIKYKVHLRVAKALQNKDIPQLLAKDMKLVPK